MPAREGVLNKIIVVIRVISDVIERDLFNPINLLNEPGLIFYVVLKSQHLEFCGRTVYNFKTFRRAGVTACLGLLKVFKDM